MYSWFYTFKYCGFRLGEVPVWNSDFIDVNRVLITQFYWWRINAILMNRTVCLIR